MSVLGNRFVILAKESNEELFDKYSRGIQLQHQDNFQKQLAILAKETPFDQLLVVENFKTAGLVWIYNRDGSKASSCGDGLSCLAWLYLKHNPSWRSVVLQPRAGIVSCQPREGDQIATNLGAPKGYVPLEVAGLPTGLRAWFVNTGVPHLLLFCKEEAALLQTNLEELAILLQEHPSFPEGTNVSLVLPLSPQALRMRTWERGCGLTKACGTGAIAAIFCAFAQGFVEEGTVRLEVPGGQMAVEITPEREFWLLAPIFFEEKLWIEVL